MKQSKVNIADIWREYVGYNTDLDPPFIIPSPGVVSNGNNYVELQDGNLETCVGVSATTCSISLKVMNLEYSSVLHSEVKVISPNRLVMSLMAYG